MKRLFFVALICCLPMVAKAAKDDAAARDQASLQGVWQMQSMDFNGGQSPSADEIKKVKLTVKDNKMSHPDSDGTILEATFTIVASEKPKQIDMTPTNGPEKGKTMAGIYSVEDDVLKLCFSKPSNGRPKEIKAGKDQALLILKREKP